MYVTHSNVCNACVFQVLPLLIGPLSRVIEITSMETALQSFKSIVHGSNEPLSFVLTKQVRRT